MGTESTQRTHTLSAAYVLHLVDLVGRWGIDPPQLLAGFDLTRDDLVDPERALPHGVAVAIFERAAALTGEPALGIYLGLQMRASAHGILGFAAMSAKNVRDAIGLAVRYMVIRTTALSLRAQVAEGIATLVLDEHADLRGARESYVFSILVGFWRMGSVLAGHRLDVTLDLALPRPPYYGRFEDALPPARFDQPVHQLVLRDLAQLEAPLSMADATSLRLAKDQCDQLLLSMGLDGELAPRVRAVLSRHEGELLSLPAVARGLRLSVRTFRRHLEAEGVTFSALVDDERRRRALMLLRSRDLSIQQVGDRLGYSDVANFNRAFRRWTGKTPSAYRNGE